MNPPALMSPLRRPGGPLRTAAKIAAVAKVMAVSRLTYFAEVLAKVVFLGVVLFTLSSLWRVVGRHQDIRAMTGYDLEQLIWYLAFAEVMLTSAPPLTTEALEIDREVRSGDIAYRLTRPLPYLLYHLGNYLGLRLANLLILAPPLFLITFALVGAPSLAAPAVGVALGAGLLALIVDGIWCFALSMASFWVEDTFGLHLTYRRCLMLLGGVLVPIAAYPSWLRRIAEALPFRVLISGPAKMFLQADCAGATRLVAAQLGFGLVGMVPLALLYRAGIKRVAANGG